MVARAVVAVHVKNCTYLRQPPQKRAINVITANLICYIINVIQPGLDSPVLRRPSGEAIHVKMKIYNFSKYACVFVGGTQSIGREWWER